MYRKMPRYRYCEISTWFNNPHILASLEFLPGQGTFSSSENGEI
jgi:hypothetical protein